MTTIIDGKKTAQQIREEIKKEVASMEVKPGLAVIMVGLDSASSVYVRNKIKACEDAGFLSKSHQLPADTMETELLDLIAKLAVDDSIHGILVQLPLPSHISESAVIEAIPPYKDADCFHNLNTGKVLTKKSKDKPLLISPCTPAGIIELLDRYNISVAGKNAVIVGRSNIVGKPLAIMLLDRDATVTIAHSKTKELSQTTLSADILISAAGVANLIKKEMVKQGAVVIDVGTNRSADGKLIGDVDFENVKNKTSFITPVPGGVGPMTIAMLLKNTLKLAKIKTQGGL
jgi:methylenetetrahydrofolate dehydrogenase (NADP+) / methenyltetrahydrofolate cyclohydrolase